MMYSYRSHFKGVVMKAFIAYSISFLIIAILNDNKVIDEHTKQADKKVLIADKAIDRKQEAFLWQEKM